MPSSYEVLVDIFHSGLSRHVTYPVKRFDYGDGFYDQITTGDVAGTIVWTLNLNRAFRDVSPIAPAGLVYAARYYGTNGLDGSLVSSSVPTSYPQSRVNYLWYFFKRRMEFGDPFWFVDVTHKTVALRLGYLCSVIKTDIDFKQDAQDSLRYSASIQFQQARGWQLPPAYGKVSP